jgi:hypothetical protein
VTEPLLRDALILVPVVAAWVITVIDIARRRPLSRRARFWWLLLITLVPAAMVAWLLARPVDLAARAAAAAPPPDSPATRLVDLVERHDRGEVDDAAFALRLRELLGAPP